jgi:translation initiation factor 2 subunit 3
LIYAIEEVIKTPKKDKKDLLKMYVVRSFDVNSPGTHLDTLKGGVVGGSIISGVLKIGDEIELSPGINNVPIVTKVLSINTESGSLDEANAGGLIAIGTLLDPSVTQNDKMKGQVLSKPGTLPKPVTRIKMTYKSIDRLLVDDLKKPLIMNEPLVLQLVLLQM